jgi:hypothetical protein
MSEPPKDKDQEKGDEVLRRLLKTPPDPKTGKGKPVAPDGSKDSEGVPAGCSAPRHPVQS